MVIWACLKCHSFAFARVIIPTLLSFLLKLYQVLSSFLLLVRKKTSLSTPSLISSQAAGVGHYLLLPSASSLLIKPVVVSELLLPVEAGEEDKPTTDAMDSIAAGLDQVINPVNKLTLMH